VFIVTLVFDNLNPHGQGGRTAGSIGLFPVSLFPHHFENRAKCKPVVAGQKDSYGTILADGIQECVLLFFLDLIFVFCFMLAFEWSV
jgi:hypothetical protein